MYNVQTLIQSTFGATSWYQKSIANNPSSSRMNMSQIIPRSEYGGKVGGSPQVNLSQDNLENGFDEFMRERSRMNMPQDNPPNGFEEFLRRSYRLNTSQDMSQQSDYSGCEWSHPLTNWFGFNF